MRDLIWLIIVLMIIGWLFGYFYLSLGGFIHILLVLAIIAVLWRLITGRQV